MEDGSKPSKLTADCSLQELSLTLTGDDQLAEADGSLTRTVKYQLAWKSLPKDGPFHGELHFAVNRGQRGTVNFTVPFSGDSVAGN